MRRALCVWALAASATLCELGACAWPFAVDARGWPAMAALHAAAAVLALAAACVRNRGLSPAERDAVLLCASVVPLAGPALAWAIPRREGDAPELDAHSAFERRRFDEGIDTGFAPRSTYTGDFLTDLSRRIDGQSHAQALRDGSLQEKRAAIRRLCALGGRRHLDLVRQVLTDPEDELRLVAYAELGKVEHEHERALARAEERVQLADARPERWTELAQCHLDYARSGVLDPAFAAHHLRLAAEAATRAREEGDHGAACAGVGGSASTERGLLAEAHAWLDACDARVAQTREVRLARAELAWRERDVATARRLAIELAHEAEELPEWIEALLPAPLNEQRAA